MGLTPSEISFRDLSGDGLLASQVAFGQYFAALGAHQDGRAALKTALMPGPPPKKNDFIGLGWALDKGFSRLAARLRHLASFSHTRSINQHTWGQEPTIGVFRVTR